MNDDQLRADVDRAIANALKRLPPFSYEAPATILLTLARNVALAILMGDGPEGRAALRRLFERELGHILERYRKAGA